MTRELWEIFSLPRRFEKGTAGSELNFRVAPGVANQISGVSSATPATPLAPPLCVIHVRAALFPPPALLQTLKCICYGLTFDWSAPPLRT